MKTVLEKRKAAARRAWVVCAYALASALVVGSSARAEGESGLTVSVRVYNYAGVSKRVIGGAEREAGRVFTAAGIDMTWLDCLAPRAQVGSGPTLAETTNGASSDCDASVKGATVGLRLLSRSSNPSKDFSDEMFGFATGSDLASVFYQRVVDLAWGVDKDGNEIPWILGDVIAHELGHLLLGTNSHSPAGIMCANWNEDYLRLALRGRQLFSQEQSASMRATIARKQAELIQP
jgi:hypothetical protein